MRDVINPRHLRDLAIERREVGWEIGDVMTPADLDELADELDRLRQIDADLRHVLKEVIAAGGIELAHRVTTAAIRARTEPAA